MSERYETSSGADTKPLTIHEFPIDERPREKLKRIGAKSISDAELIAILLRTGKAGENVLTMSQRLILSFKNLRGVANADFDDLVARDGISTAKACQILAAIELGRRVSDLRPEDHPRISSPEDIAKLSSDIANLPREHFKVIALNTKNHVQDVEELYAGSVNAAIVRPAEVFRYGIKRNATSIAVVHNHPSGDPTPSSQDIEVTKRLTECGKLLGIELLDHVIIGHGRWVSLREYMEASWVR